MSCNAKCRFDTQLKKTLGLDITSRGPTFEEWYDNVSTVYYV